MFKTLYSSVILDSIATHARLALEVARLSGVIARVIMDKIGKLKLPVFENLLQYVVYKRWVTLGSGSLSVFDTIQSNNLP